MKVNHLARLETPFSFILANNLAKTSITGEDSFIIVATSTAKSPAVKAMIEGPMSIDCPASLLRKHPNIDLFFDRAAAKDLS